MGKVINAVSSAVVSGTAEVVSVVDPNAGQVVASQAQAIGDSAELLTAKAGNAMATAANATGDWIEQGVTKDGAITNFVQDYVPAGGFVTAIAHAAAGNEEYAQYAAVKGVSTTVVTAAAVAGSLGGPAGAILAGGLAGAAVSAWEGGMKTVLDPSVQGKLDDLSVENVLISGAIGAAGAAVGVGLGKVAGAAGKAWSSKFPKATATEIGTVVQFTRGRAGAVVGTKLNPVIPLWQFMTPGQKVSAIGGVVGKKALKKAGTGGLTEAIKATGLTAAVLTGLGMGPDKPPTTPPDQPTPVVGIEQEDTKKWKILVATGVLVVGGGLILNNVGGDDDSTNPADTVVVTTVAPTIATTIPATTVVETTAAPATTPATTPPTSTTTTVAASLPGAPTITSVEIDPAGTCRFVITFTHPNDGGSPITNYFVSGSGSGTGSANSTSITVSGTRGPSSPWVNTFRVRARNAVGDGPRSAAASGPNNDTCFEP